MRLRARPFIVDFVFVALHSKSIDIEIARIAGDGHRDIKNSSTFSKKNALRSASASARYWSRTSGCISVSLLIGCLMRMSFPAAFSTFKYSRTSL